MPSPWAAPDTSTHSDEPHPAFASLAPPPRRRWTAAPVALLTVVVLLLAASAIGLAAMDRAEESADSSGTTIADVLPELKRFVEQARGLTFTGDVPIELLPDAAFRERLAGTEDEDSSEEATGDEATLKALRLLDPDDDLESQLEELRGAAVTGFYDTEKNELVIRGGAVTPAVRVTLVHELVHALQDQRLDIDRFDDPAFTEREDETSLGALALIEGDADRIEEDYRKTLSAGDQRAVEREQARSLGDLDDINPVLATLLSFPYQVGPEVVKTLLAAGGQDRLDAAYRNPPITSEQLIDPAKYLAGEQPEKVAAPAADGEVVDEGALGQFGLTLVLIKDGSHGSALRAANGWGGDAYVTWRDSERSCTRLSVVGDTASDSDELFTAFETWSRGGAVVRRSGDVVTVTSCS